MIFPIPSSTFQFILLIVLVKSILHRVETLKMIENPDEPSTFRFGQYHLRNYYDDNKIRVLDGSIKGDTTLLLSCLRNEWQAELALSIFYAARGMTIEQAVQSLGVVDEFIDLSHDLNACSSNLPLDEQELLLQVSLSAYPDNLFTAKNLGFLLEWFGYLGAAKEIYRTVGYRFNDLGLLLHEALGTSGLWETGQETRIYQDIRSKLHQYVNMSFASIPDDILLLMRNIPYNLQYVGFPPSELYNLLSQVLYKNYPFLNHAYIAHTFANKSAFSHGDIDEKIRLGIVATTNSNSSPGLCLTSLFNSVFRNRKFDHVGRTVEIEVFFFDLPNSTTVFADLMHTHSKESFTLDTGKIHSSAELIADQNLDILMYIALPTEKFTYYLAHLRLAPVQIQFGWGHPFSSGIPAIDYTIISIQMLQNQTSLRDLTFSKEPFQYYEQLVTFESQAYYLNDPTTFVDENQYTDHIVHINHTFSTISCEKTNEFLKRIGIYPNITAEGIGCMPIKSFGANVSQESYRVYMVMQMYKKMHPAFDLVLTGIVSKDPSAKILMMDGSRSIIPRILKILDYQSPEFIFKNFVFVKRTEHYEYLKLMKLSSVFLNTFPFGAGVTSSEAIAMCLPVIVLSNYSHTLPLALSQVVALGDDISKYILAHDLYSYIDKAVAVANGQFSNDMNIKEFKNLICKRKENLFDASILSAVSREFVEFFINIASY